MRTFLSGLVAFSIIGLWTQAALADQVPIGDLAFFNVNAPPSGQNSFFLFNFTGGATSPDPGVMSNIDFSGTLALNVLLPGGTASTMSTSFSSVAPGANADLIDLSTNIQILSGMLGLTLDNLSVTLNNGQPVTLSPDPISLALLPLNGATSLNPGDTFRIDVTPVPEPGTLFLFGTVLAACFARRLRRRVTR
jgi:hypothetical protein